MADAAQEVDSHQLPEGGGGLHAVPESLDSQAFHHPVPKYHYFFGGWCAKGPDIDVARSVSKEDHESQHHDSAEDANGPKCHLPGRAANKDANHDCHNGRTKSVGCLQEAHAIAQVGAEPVRCGGDDWYVETRTGGAEEYPIGNPQVPDLRDHASHQSADDKSEDADQDDLSCAVAVGAVPTERCQKSACDTG